MNRKKIELPVIGTSTPGEEKILKQLGFDIGPPFDDNPSFRPAILPEGWIVKQIDKKTQAIMNEEEDVIFRVLSPHQRCVYMVIG